MKLYPPAVVNEKRDEEAALTWKANNNGKLLLYGAISNIVASEAATLAWLTKPIFQYHLQKLNQEGKATNSLVQLPATMTLNDSQSLAGHTSSISTMTKNSPQLTECKRDLLNQRNGAVLHLLLKRMTLLIWFQGAAWDESFAHFATNQKAISEQGWGFWTKSYSSIRTFNWQVLNLQAEANNNQPVSFIPPSGINLCQGITRTLVD